MTRKEPVKNHIRSGNPSRGQASRAVHTVSKGTKTTSMPSDRTVSARRKAQNTRMKRMRRKRIRNTIFLLLLLIVLCTAGGFGVYMLKGGDFSTPANSFNAFSEFDNTLTSKEEQRAAGFAHDLCVVTKDVALDSVSLDDSQSGVLLNLSDKKVLYAKGAYNKVNPASITKILTTLLACENLNAKTNITVSEKASTSVTAGDSSIYAAPGEKFTRDQALMAVMLQSANEMSVAVAEEVSGSVKKFAELMNWRAKLFGCKNTHFNNPNGLPDENHYTTASDMAKIAKSAWLNPLFRRYCTKRYYEIPPTNKFAEARQLLNHHKMMKNGEYYYEGVRGGKTGYTDASGNTLVTYCKRGNITLVAVILNSTSAANAYSDTASLFNYGFENFEKVDMKVSMEPVPFKVLPCDKYILKNNGNTYPFYYQTKVYVTLPKGIKKSQLNKRQAVLQNAVGPLRLKSKYYYKKQMVGWGMQYERNIVSDLLLAS